MTYCSSIFLNSLLRNAFKIFLHNNWFSQNWKNAYSKIAFDIFAQYPNTVYMTHFHLLKSLYPAVHLIYSFTIICNGKWWYCFIIGSIRTFILRMVKVPLVLPPCSRPQCDHDLFRDFTAAGAGRVANYEAPSLQVSSSGKCAPGLAAGE
jgi:hypothetical protein